MEFVRAPAVAGYFYKLNRENLIKQIEACFKHSLGPGSIEEMKVLSAISPHAGYEYSGPVAAWTYSRLRKSNFVIIGPNHTGLGPFVSVWPKGSWATPLGKVKVDENFVKYLISSGVFEPDVVAHQHEHSVEVQIPFLQYRFGNDFKIVPVVMMNDYPSKEFLKFCKSLAKIIHEAVEQTDEDWVVLASSDFTHYEPQHLAEAKDISYIDSLKKLDTMEFFQKLEQNKGSVCGFGPIAVAVEYAKLVGAKKGELLKYATSGDVTGDYSSVVGYASMVFV